MTSCPAVPGLSKHIFFSLSQDPVRFNRRQILENNYARWHWTDVHFGQKASKASWYIQVNLQFSFFKFGIYSEGDGG